MGMMQSCHWRDEELRPAEDIPPAVTLPQSPGDGILTTPAQTNADESYQQRPLQGKKKRPRHRRETNPVGPEEHDGDEDEEEDPNKDSVMIHGLSVKRYREIYYSVLTPAALSALSTNNPAVRDTAKGALRNFKEYMTQVLELKQRLWGALYRPQLQETVGEDGRVHISETFDLT